MTIRGPHEIVPIIQAMQGLHLTADLRDCSYERPLDRAVMTEPEALRAL